MGKNVIKKRDPQGAELPCFIDGSQDFFENFEILNRVGEIEKSIAVKIPALYAKKDNLSRNARSICKADQE